MKHLAAAAAEKEEEEEEDNNEKTRNRGLRDGTMRGGSSWTYQKRPAQRPQAPTGARGPEKRRRNKPAATPLSSLFTHTPTAEAGWTSRILYEYLRFSNGRSMSGSWPFGTIPGGFEPQSTRAGRWYAQRGVI